MLSSFDLVLVVGLGLGIGISFVIVIALVAGNIDSKIPEHESPEIAFSVPAKLPEVKLLLSKYPARLITFGMSRDSVNETILYDYSVQKVADVKENGSWPIHRLDLFLTYDESHGLVSTNPNARLLQINATCTEPSPKNVYQWILIEPAVQDGKVLNYISDTKCIS